MTNLLDQFRSALLGLFTELLTVNPIKSAVTSIAGAATGQFCFKLNFILAFNSAIFFQHMAWTIAALAGVISILNGVTKLIDWHDARKKKRHGKNK